MAQKTNNIKSKEGKKTEVLSNKKNVVPTRGRIFEGTVTKKFPTRVVVEFERPVYVPKYQRFYKKKTRLHARLPKDMEINVGDYIKIQECRPLSKIIHFIVIQKVRSASQGGKNEANYSQSN